MKRYVVLMIFLLIMIPLFGGIIKRVKVGTHPNSLTMYKTENGDTYFLILDEGTSCIYIFNEDFELVRVIDEYSDDGIVKIIIHERKLYCMAFHSGRLIVYDLKGDLNSWKPFEVIFLKSRIFTGTFLKNTLALLSINKEIIFLDTVNLSVVKRQNLPVKALSIKADEYFFYVTLFYNYSQVENAFNTEEGLYVYDEKGTLKNKIDTGKRPSYVFISDRIIGVVNYLDNVVQIFKRIGSYIFELNKSDIGKFSNFPFVKDNLLLICSLIENRIYKYNLITEESGIIETTGKGPLKCEFDLDNYYVISVFSGSFEILSKAGHSVKNFDLQGYPVDFLIFEECAMILLQETWNYPEDLGELVVISF
ncbi:MAG: hypothetical protein U9O65_10640 [Thermotogota bacterium]|nr:hypothetical protein [Thermotogota bacterium]